MISLVNLFEVMPKNPDTIIVKNEFYPEGLTQEKIYNYYIKNKQNILEQTKDRDVMIFLATDLNKVVVKRRADSSSGYIKLNSENYNELLSGRTLSIHSTMNQKEEFGIVDIDCYDFNQAKEGAAEIYDFLYKFNKKIILRYTGKDSFHVLYFFDQKININSVRMKLEDLLMNLAVKKYTINEIRNKQKINLDLSPNKIKGGFITLNSLSVLGLKCVEISRKNILTFDRKNAII